MSDNPITILASEYKAMTDRIATLESDERRRIAGQVLAVTYGLSPHGIAYMDRKAAFEIADAIIRKMDAPTKSPA